MNSNYIRNLNNVNSNRDMAVGYSNNPIRRDNLIKNDYFSKDSARALAIKKVNTTLSVILLFVIFVSISSYYFVVSSEMKLNKYSREITLLNVKNAELQNELDRKKSFNNVDLTMRNTNMLQRPDKVIEVKEVAQPNQNADNTLSKIKLKAWTLGY